MLTIQNLSHTYSTKLILDEVCLHIPQGHIVSLMGSSGSGKSTLFNLITGVLPVRRGAIYIAGETGKKAHLKASYMMQDTLMLPWRTIKQNLSLVCELGKGKNNKDEIEFYLNEVGLANAGNQYPCELSGGMLHRAALARVLLEGRPLLLLDEPFAHLDLELKLQMHALLEEMRTKHGRTILLITHDIRDASAISDSIYELKNGQITACLEGMSAPAR